jgi:hypothetical protein
MGAFVEKGLNSVFQAWYLTVSKARAKLSEPECSGKYQSDIIQKLNYQPIPEQKLTVQTLVKMYPL